VDARWEPCGENELYNAWMCSKLKAENYAILVDAYKLDCMKKLKADLPIFKDIEKYCSIGSMIYANVLAIILIILI
jgi:hypothetical protein